MEIRKQKERNHYDKRAQQILKENYAHFNWNEGSKNFGIIARSHFKFTEEKIRRTIREKDRQNAMILDYGCGTGVHSIFLAKQGACVYGIDISESAITIAKEWANRKHVKKQIVFQVMDGEKLLFPENFFDIVFNCDTLSCVDREKAFPEIVRVLKPDGYFISVDTLGHNPILNLRRKIHFMRGSRTFQTFNNILTMNDIETARQYFDKTKVRFFHLLTLAGIPLEKIFRFVFIGRFLEKIDKQILTFPFFQKYAFKVVFIFSSPKKGYDKKNI